MNGRTGGSGKFGAIGRMLLVIVIVVVALLVVLDWPPNAAAWRSIVQVGLIVGATLRTLAILAMGLIYGGKYRFRYRLDDRGITADPSGTTAWKNRIVNLLLVLSGRPSAMGAGLLAQSCQHQEVAWSQVDRVVPEEASRTIVLRRGRRVAMLGACRPDNYDQVLGEIRRRMAPGSG